MTRALAVIALLALAACHKQPSFDERYAKAEQDVRARSAEIDNQLAQPEAK